MILPRYLVIELAKEFDELSEGYSKFHEESSIYVRRGGLGFDSVNSPLMDENVNKYAHHVAEMREGERRVKK